MYKLDHKLKIKSEDLIYHLHEYDIDLVSNHVYLMSVDRGYEVEPDGGESGIDYVISKRFIKNINICMRTNPDKPIVIHMKTCFSRKTLILTDQGQKKIVDIKIGDNVLTHTGKFKKVIDVMSQMYDGDMVTLFYSRNKHNETSIKATADHPILVERNKIKKWIPIKDIEEGDIIFVESKKCEFTGEMVPYWRKKKNFNCERLKRKGKGSGQQHLEKDILPYCEKLKNEGWTVVPVGAGVIPDIIGFKDGKVKAFEIERSTAKSLEVKKEKYNNAKINEFIDEVEWIHPENKIVDTFYTWYEVDDETGFIKVKVTGKTINKNKYKQRVYNLTVDEDNSYVANHVVVHNCGGLWEEGMAIYDAIKSCPSQITILNYTHARSMSSIIFQAADKRVMMPNSYFMLHDGTYGVEGTYKQVLSTVDFDKRTEAIMLSIYAEKMNEQGTMKGQTLSKIKKWLRYQMDKKEDVFFTAEQAVDLGLADEIFNYDWTSLSKY